MSEKSVALCEIKNKIAFVSLNRPDKYNALSIQLFEELTAIGEELISNKKIRAVILSGKGKGFCSGLDVKSAMANGGGKKLMHKDNPEDQNLAQRISLVWREVPVPVIAAIHGVCFGGGFQIALGADFRFATEDSKFSIMETKWGLIPDMGASVTLPELVNIDVAKELTFTGRIFEAPEAKTLGVITKIVEDPMQAAIEFANQLKERSPDAVMYGKRLFNETWLSSDGVRLKKETEFQEKLIGSWNQL
ncbi:MAG: crotonase/enoyl-CoA hydratase family protein, partial [Gammaproteobacteria bacterium]|nr:crotonase/enoyl-CoA hydratase family protein [Gammaproteobacteria bacterium]